MAHQALPIPPHFDPQGVDKVWKVDYQERAAGAERWAREHQIQPSSQDVVRVCLLAVDVQNTFCIPDFELYMWGGAREQGR
jgi:hypothetical protein